MSREHIMKDDIARASKEKQDLHKSEKQIVAKEFEQHNNPTKSSSRVASEIKLKSG